MKSLSISNKYPINICSQLKWNKTVHQQIFNFFQIFLYGTKFNRFRVMDQPDNVIIRFLPYRQSFVSNHTSINFYNYKENCLHSHHIFCKKWLLKINKFWKNYRIKLKFNTPLEDPKRKDEFVNQLFFTNGSGCIRKRCFCKNQKFNFPATIYEMR